MLIHWWKSEENKVMFVANNIISALEPKVNFVSSCLCGKTDFDWEQKFKS